MQRVKKEPIFIPIMAKISIPFNLEEPTGQENKLQPKEIRVKEHLEKMSEITRNLSYNDIDLLRKNTHQKEIVKKGQEEREKEN